jgi:hypothetical protein
MRAWQVHCQHKKGLNGFGIVPFTAMVQAYAVAGIPSDESETPQSGLTGVDDLRVVSAMLLVRVNLICY